MGDLIILIYETALVVLALLELLSAALIFYFKDMLHVGIALSVLFFFNSVLFLAAQQPLLAVIQLFIMIGGISTYFIIAVASLGTSDFKHIRIIPIVVFSAVIFIALALPIILLNPLNGNPQGPITMATLTTEFTSQIGLFYILTLLVFATAMGSIALFNRIGERK